MCIVPEKLSLTLHDLNTQRCQFIRHTCLVLILSGGQLTSPGAWNKQIWSLGYNFFFIHRKRFIQLEKEKHYSLLTFTKFGM